MWEDTGLPWPQLSLGLILGIRLIEVKRADGKPNQGRTRLLRAGGVPSNVESELIGL